MLTKRVVILLLGLFFQYFICYSNTSSEFLKIYNFKGYEIISDTSRADSSKGKKKIIRFPSQKKLRMYGDNYVIAETAFTQGRGNIYLESYYITYYKLSAGITNSLDVEAYLSFGILGAGLKGKIYNSGALSFSVKGNYYTLINDIYFWRGSLISTFGNNDNNFSLSFNHFIQKDNFYFKPETIHQNIITFSGKIKVKDYLHFQFENLSLLTDVGITTLGFSYQKNVCKFNIGLLHTLAVDYLFTNYYVNIPYISLKIPLRSKSN